MENEYIFLIGLSFLVVVYVLFSFRLKHIKIVKENSFLIKALVKLNQSYSFQSFKEYYSYHEKHNKKRKYDRDTTEKFMNRHVYEKMSFYENIVNIASKNESNYYQYMTEYGELKSEIPLASILNTPIKQKTFLKYEEYLYKKLKLKKPPIDFKVNYKISYTSPKGRNSYSKENTYNKKVIAEEISKVRKDIKNKKSRQYVIKKERSKMTNAFRYKILKRDSFRCQICGSTAKDGVKLHVDHIIPVSKGGKTIKNNLRTLCDRCNLGKSDRIEN